MRVFPGAGGQSPPYDWSCKPKPLLRAGFPFCLLRTGKALLPSYFCLSVLGQCLDRSGSYTEAIAAGLFGLVQGFVHLLDQRFGRTSR